LTILAYDLLAPTTGLLGSGGLISWLITFGGKFSFGEKLFFWGG
jgi:hypothetical protein